MRAVGSVLADGAGSPLDQGVTSFLLIAAFLSGWVAVARLRGRGFARLPRPMSWALAGLSAVSVIMAFVLPPIIRPDVSAARPSSTARLQIVSPAPGEVFTGDPASVPIQLRLSGGRIVAFTSTKLVPNEGHVHVYLDGGLVAMTLGLDHTIDVAPGEHHLVAEFVAVDHAPFAPRVQAAVDFTVGA